MCLRVRNSVLRGNISSKRRPWTIIPCGGFVPPSYITSENIFKQHLTSNKTKGPALSKRSPRRPLFCPRKKTCMNSALRSFPNRKMSMIMALSVPQLAAICIFCDPFALWFTIGVISAQYSGARGVTLRVWYENWEDGAIEGEGDRHHALPSPLRMLLQDMPPSNSKFSPRMRWRQ